MARLRRRLIRRPRRARFIPTRPLIITIGKVQGAGKAALFPRLLGKVTGTGQVGHLVRPPTRRLTESGRWVSLVVSLDERGNRILPSNYTEQGEFVFFPVAAAPATTIPIAQVTGTGLAAAFTRVNKVTGQAEVAHFEIGKVIVIGQVIGTGDPEAMFGAGIILISKIIGTGQARLFQIPSSIGKVIGTGLVRTLTVTHPAPNYGRCRIDSEAEGILIGTSALGLLGSDV